MTSLSMIGLGALGSAIAEAFVDGGHALTVWNRTESKAEALVAKGAERAATADEAIRAGGVTVVCVNDWDSVASVLARPGVEEALCGRVLVNLTTFTGEEAARLGTRLRELGATYLQGCVNAYPRDVGKPETSVLYAGDRDAYSESEDALRALGGRPTYIGEEPAAVATLYMALWSYYFTAVVGFYEAAAMAADAGVPFDEMRSLVQDVMSPVIAGSLADTAARLERGDLRSDQSRLANTAATMRDYAASYSAAGLHGAFIAATRDYTQAAVDAGDGDKGLAALVATVGRRNA
jgi:3-hydroxyisobutyrate dehydrogenase-like beta-hydroxyacid dehydrogenase